MLRSVALICYVGPVPDIISQRQLRNDNAEVIRRVEAGESFTVTKHGRPVADLAPHRDSSSDATVRFLQVEELLSRTADLPSWGGEDLDREQRGLDALVDDEQRDPWP